MPDDKTIAALTVVALERNRRLIDILTTFFQEASVLVFVFGILDLYASNKLTVRIGVIVGALGFVLLLAAFAMKSLFYRALRRNVVHWLTLLETSAEGVK